MIVRYTYEAKRPAMALMMTLFFIIAIVSALAISLTQTRQVMTHVNEGQFLVQTSALLEDTLSLFKGAKELDEIVDATTFDLYMSMASVIPLPEVNGLRVLISMESDRGKFNINTLNAKDKKLLTMFQEYLQNSQYNIQDINYLTELLMDAMSGKRDLYYTDIFDQYPLLYRERIVNKKHLDQILDYYILTRHDNAVSLVPWEELFRFGDNNDSTLDVNYMKQASWQMILPFIQETTAVEIAESGEVYEKLDDISYLDEGSIKILKDYNATTYQPFIQVELDVNNDKNQSSRVKFEYDLKNKKAYKFEYTI